MKRRRQVTLRRQAYGHHTISICHLTQRTNICHSAMMAEIRLLQTSMNIYLSKISIFCSFTCVLRHFLIIAYLAGISFALEVGKAMLLFQGITKLLRRIS